MTRPVTAATIAALVFVVARQAGRIARLNRRVRQLRGDTLEQADELRRLLEESDLVRTQNASLWAHLDRTRAWPTAGGGEGVGR